MVGVLAEGGEKKEKKVLLQQGGREMRQRVVMSQTHKTLQRDSQGQAVFDSFK